MSILVDEKTRLLVQGITGKEGSYHALRSKEYGANLVAGVTPGRGGMMFDETVPGFNSVEQAVAETGANASLIVGPAPVASDAIVEAVGAGFRERATRRRSTSARAAPDGPSAFRSTRKRNAIPASSLAREWIADSDPAGLGCDPLTCTVDAKAFAVAFAVGASIVTLRPSRRSPSTSVSSRSTFFARSADRSETKSDILLIARASRSRTASARGVERSLSIAATKSACTFQQSSPTTAA